MSRGKSIDRPGISRRGFVAGMTVILGGITSLLIGILVIGYLISPVLQKDEESDEWIPLGRVEDLIEDEPTLFTFTRGKQVGWERSGFSYGVYVTKKPEGNYDVFSNVCTLLSYPSIVEGRSEPFFLSLSRWSLCQGRDCDFWPPTATLGPFRIQDPRWAFNYSSYREWIDQIHY